MTILKTILKDRSRSKLMGLIVILTANIKSQKKKEGS